MRSYLRNTHIEEGNEKFVYFTLEINYYKIRLKFFIFYCYLEKEN